MNQNLMDPMVNSYSRNNSCVLVISHSCETIKCIDTKLSQQGFEIIVADELITALNVFNANRVNYIFIEPEHTKVSIDEFIYKVRIRAGEFYVPIVVIADAEKERLLSECISSGCDDFLFKPFTATALISRISSLEQVHELKNLYKSSVNEQLVAKQILAYALSERNIQFEEIQLLSKSKAIFSGDLFLTVKRPDGGLHVLLADFTGHGLSAAIGALPVADIFCVMTNKGFELEAILEHINNKLHTLLPVSMFMACSMLKIHADLNFVSVWNGGMPDIYIRNSHTGDIKSKIKASHIPLGIDEATSDNFALDSISICKEDQFILYTDGLTEAENAKGEMYGYENLDRCLNDNKNSERIFPTIVDDFNRFCGSTSPNDDVTLACIPCNSCMTEIDDRGYLHSVDSSTECSNDWYWYMELSGDNLVTVNPVPLVMDEVKKMPDYAVCDNRLSDVLNALYNNAIEHGLMFSTDVNKASEIDYFYENINREKTKNREEYLRIGLKKIEHDGDPALLVSIEDSGCGFDHQDLMHELINGDSNEGAEENGISLVYKLTRSLHYHGKGNHVEAIISASR